MLTTTLRSRIAPMISRNMAQNHPEASILALILSFMLFWHGYVCSELGFRAVAACLFYLLLCLSYGRQLSLLIAIPGTADIRGIFQLVAGYFLFNTLLFVLTVASPFGLAANLAALTVLAGILEILLRDRHAALVLPAQSWRPMLLCVGIAGAAASLWAHDAQSSGPIDGQTALYRVWLDVFYHMHQISAFRDAHGLASISNISMAGEPARIYHYAMYVSAAALAELTGSNAFQVYAAYLLPFGILLSGLGAFILAAALLGAWPAVAATAAVLLLPDAYQQGFLSRYLGYYFITQVNLGMLYGLACVCLAWSLIFDGCHRGRYQSVAYGYGFILLTVVYKSHLFVANSFPALIFPCLFFSKVAWRWRAAYAVAAVGVYAAAIHYAQHIDSIPIIRLDGSGLGSYIAIVLNSYDNGMVKDYLLDLFYQGSHAKAVLGLCAAAMILLSSFGLWTLLLPAVAWLGRNSLPLPWLSFPFLIAGNYMVMALGLAVDTHRVGTLDELLNRPLSWAYFAVAAWTAACAYRLLFGNAAPQAGPRRTAGVVLLCVLLAATGRFSANLQTYPVWPGYENYRQFNAVPLCLQKAGEYIRRHSREQELLQDSENDRNIVVSALAERQDYVVDDKGKVFNQKKQDRIDALEYFKKLRDPQEIAAFAAQRQISWYILEPQTGVSWPSAFLDQAEFICGNYRIFHFPPLQAVNGR